MAPRIQRLHNILITPLLACRIVRIQALLTLAYSCFEALNDLVVAAAVVDNRVAFGFVDEGLDEGDAVAGNADEGVDVGPDEEFDGEGADGTGGAVDDDAALGQVTGRVDEGPWLGEAEASILRKSVLWWLNQFV